jgi:hypothetical protein
VAFAFSSVPSVLMLLPVHGVVTISSQQTLSRLGWRSPIPAAFSSTYPTAVPTHSCPARKRRLPTVGKDVTMQQRNRHLVVS